jgi:hypothetical protein
VSTAASGHDDLIGDGEHVEQVTCPAAGFDDG